MSSDRKITERHRQRRAVVYVRQSTLVQVERHTESAQRQYALRERAIDLGWPAASVVVVDEDTGRSGASTDGRLGFKELVAEVGLGHVGLILALEVSRFARSSAGWHRLIDLCALTGTLIADSDGIYSPADFNDRLLAGLKGTMSEAELHLIRARLDGGLRSKAQRGELRMHLAVEFDRDDDDGRIVLPRPCRRPGHTPRARAPTPRWSRRDGPPRERPRQEPVDRRDRPDRQREPVDHGGRRLPRRSGRLPRLRAPGDHVLPRAEHPHALRVRLHTGHRRAAARGADGLRRLVRGLPRRRMAHVRRRNNRRRVGRIVVGRGRDAVDVALLTTFGPVTLTEFEVRAA